MSMHIQWYPGHMTKTRRMMEKHMRLVDLVIELVDARIPLSSKNPEMDAIAIGKPRLIIFTKADLADVISTTRWEAHFRKSNFFSLKMNIKTGKQKENMAKLIECVQKIMKDKIERQKSRGRLAVPIRAMVVGIPNVGKSTFINMLAGKAVTAVADKPGVTRGRQWIAVRGTSPVGTRMTAPQERAMAGKPHGDANSFIGFDLMDTPGVLWPKFEDPRVGLKLAIIGSVSETILDKVTLAEELIRMLDETAPKALAARYKLETGENNEAKKEPREMLTEIGQSRGYKMKGDTVDLERTAIMLLDEFRAGKLGRLTLELPSLA